MSFLQSKKILKALLAAALLWSSAPVYAQAAALGSDGRMESGRTEVSPSLPVAGGMFYEYDGLLSGPLADDQEVYEFLKGSQPFALSAVEKDAIDIILLEKKEDEWNQTHYLYQQTVNGIPVHGGYVHAHLNEERRIYSLLDNRSAVQAPESADPALTADQAIQMVKADIEQELGQAVSSEMPPLPPIKHKAELLLYPADEGWVLSYKVDFGYYKPAPNRWTAYVDANSGKVLVKYSQNHGLDKSRAVKGKGIGYYGDPRSLNVYADIDNTYYLIDVTKPMAQDGAIWTYDWNDTSAPVSSETSTFYDPQAVDAHYYAGMVYDFYRDHFGRDSIDGEGMPIISVVHTPDDDGSPLHNAYWLQLDDTGFVFYGDGDVNQLDPALPDCYSCALDVVAHELTHGIIMAEAALEYHGQSGALNESIADMMAAVIDSENPWTIGEDTGTTLRSLEDPHLYWQPKHVYEYVDLPLDQDNGGVHINSGIPNYAAYLIASKADAAGLDGRKALGYIAYYALTNYLTPTSDFAQARVAFLNAVKDASRKMGLRSEQEQALYQAVKEAWAEVGIGDLRITEVTALSSTAIEITFSESIQFESAKDPYNYFVREFYPEYNRHFVSYLVSKVVVKAPNQVLILLDYPIEGPGIYSVVAHVVSEAGERISLVEFFEENLDNVAIPEVPTVTSITYGIQENRGFARLAWEAVEDAKYYALYKDFGEEAIVSSDTLSYTFTNVEAGAHVFGVSAINYGGESEMTYDIVFVPGTFAGVPTLHLDGRKEGTMLQPGDAIVTFTPKNGMYPIIVDVELPWSAGNPTTVKDIVYSDFTLYEGDTAIEVYTAELIQQGDVSTIRLLFEEPLQIDATYTLKMSELSNGDEIQLPAAVTSEAQAAVTVTNIVYQVMDSYRFYDVKIGEATPGKGSGGGGGFFGGGGGGFLSVPTVEATADGDVLLRPEAKVEVRNGKSVSVVAITKDQLQRAYAAAKDDTVPLVIEVDTDGASELQLPIASLMELGGFPMIEFRTSYASYTVPKSLLDPKELAARFGADSSAEWIAVVEIAPVTDAEAAALERSAKERGARVTGGPLHFALSVKANGETFPYDSFGKVYAERTMTVDGTLNPSQVTAARYEADTRTWSFVPATFQPKDGKTAAVIKSNRNSVYALLEFAADFSDVSGHWAEEEIELLASKLILSGTGNDQFSPAKEVTRAEFAAMLTRSLGLKGEAEAAAFLDVQQSDWFAGAVGAAAEAGLITGYEDGSFRPNERITREQMAVMFDRALSFVGKRPDQRAPIHFKDMDAVSPWAGESVVAASKARIISGHPDGSFAPHAKATRAEAAVMLKRLLTYLDFIDS